MRKLTTILFILFIAACAAQSTSTRRELAVPIKQEVASPTAAAEAPQPGARRPEDVRERHRGSVSRARTAGPRYSIAVSL